LPGLFHDAINELYEMPALIDYNYGYQAHNRMSLSCPLGDNLLTWNLALCQQK